MKIFYEKNKTKQNTKQNKINKRNKNQTISKQKPRFTNVCHTCPDMHLATFYTARLWLHPLQTEREREMFYLTTYSTHFIYGYIASDIWLRVILIVRKETCCCHIGYSYRLTARVLLYAPSHRQDNTYHGLCYTSRGALAGTRNSSVGPPHKDRSDDPSHYERTLYLWATSRSHLFKHSIITLYVITHF